MYKRSLKNRYIHVKGWVKPKHAKIKHFAKNKYKKLKNLLRYSVKVVYTTSLVLLVYHLYKLFT